MKSLEKYKRLIQAIKNTDKFSKDELDNDTMNIAVRLFNGLPISDKFEILQNAVNTVTTSNEETGSDTATNPTEAKNNTSVTESVEDFNKKELIKLKMFFLRFLTIVILIVFGLFTLIYILLGSSVLHTGNALVDEAIAIFNYLFN